MNDRKVLATGLVGTVIAVICCFSPVLVLLLSAVGLSAWIGWLDYVLFPALALFVFILAYGLWLRMRSGSDSAQKEGEWGHV